MKKLLLPIIVIIASCSFLENDHEIKKGVRKYLEQTLHDPESMEEITWTINRDYVFELKDTSDHDSPLVIDYRATNKRIDSFGEIYHVRLEYRAKNGFGAMRKSEIFATYYEETKNLQFEDVAYSYEYDDFLGVESTGLMEPRRAFLKNQFFQRSRGEATLEDFWREYPEL